MIRVNFMRDKYINKIAKIKMSEKRMANFLYSLIMCHAIITDSYGVGIYNYTYKQNVYNYVEIMISIHPDMIETFEKQTGLELRDPLKISLNAETI